MDFIWFAFTKFVERKIDLWLSRFPTVLDKISVLNDRLHKVCVLIAFQSLNMFNLDSKLCTCYCHENVEEKNRNNWHFHTFGLILVVQK